MTPELIRIIYESASMQRWNDYPRMVELVELDKQAHKLIIAWFLAKREERDYNFFHLIEAAIFEFLRRVIVTDIRPDVFRHVLQEKKAEINSWVFRDLSASLDTEESKPFLERLEDYLNDESMYLEERKLLNAAHYMATRWEFGIVYQSSRFLQGVESLRREVEAEIQHFKQYRGVVDIGLGLPWTKLVDLFGRLRFQVRWAQTPRIPKTSVLGHMLIVALFSYFYCLKVKACPKRTSNTFFCALFHDLPEALTRDIISPVKRSVKGLDDLIVDYEIGMIQRDILPVIPSSFRDEFSYLLGLYEENGVVKKKEFANRIKPAEEIKIVDGLSEYNQDSYNAVDGKAAKACDHLAAFTEAAVSMVLGVQSGELKRGADKVKRLYKGKKVGGVDFYSLMVEAEKHLSERTK